MPITAGSLPNNALLKDPSSTYNGVPVIFRKAATNHPGYPANSVTLITDRVISIKPFDAAEPGNANGHRSGNGNGRYRTSNLRQWLNTAQNPPWWTAQNLTDGVANTNNRDAPPSPANLINGNAYENERGFLAGFSHHFMNSLLHTTLTVARNTVIDGGGSEAVSDLFFLASGTEVGLANEGVVAEGSRLPIFSDNDSRISFQTQQSINQSEWPQPPIWSSVNWWLRTPQSNDSTNVRIILGSGNMFSSGPIATIGIRPLCNIQSSTLVSDTPDTDGAHVILWQLSPASPPDLSISNPILAGTNPTIAWEASTDPQNLAITYTLERSIDGGAFSAIFTGIGRTFSDSVALGVNTVQYRVKASNVLGLDSSFNISETINVITNTPPGIDGSDGYLGEKTGAFTYNYTVTDPDTGAIITVREYLNGNLLRKYTAASGAAQAVSVSHEQFLRLPNATETENPHTLIIHAVDEWGASDTRTWTFSRQETQADIMKNDPHPANIRPTRAIVTVDSQIPTGAIFQVFIANNGFDASPTWEDCTDSVLAGTIHNFTNETLTAEMWGVAVHVLADRNNATGLGYIGSIGGNFE